MTKPSWQLTFPVSAIILDCEGILTALTAMTFLAKNNGVSDFIHPPAPYTLEQSLQVISPRREQVYALGHQYFAHQTSGASTLIQLLKRLNKAVYLVTAGINPAVRMFGELLQIPSENVYAVDLRFDQQGNFLHCDETSLCLQHNNKQPIFEAIKEKHEHLIQVATQSSDLARQDLVMRRIGYGQCQSSQNNIAACCDFHIKTTSLAALLPLILTETEYADLNLEEQKIYEAGITVIQQGDVRLPDDQEKKPLPVLDQSLQFE